MQDLHVSREVGYRLAALCDGEGHFGIVRAATAYKCRFVIGLRADDQQFLQRMRDAVGLGTVVVARAYSDGDRRNEPAVQWRISAKEECLALTRILDEFPLWSKKSRDYALWREAVFLWQELRHRGRRRLDWSAIAALDTELRALRAYGHDIASRPTVGEDTHPPEASG